MAAANPTTWSRTLLIDRLATLLERVGEDRWAELEERLTAGTLGVVDPELRDLTPLDGAESVEVFESARAEAERQRYITRQRQNLHRQIEAAQGEIRRALDTMRTLDDLGDVEYEGGDADTEHHLNEALRSLRAAQAVKPSDADGNNN